LKKIDRVIPAAVQNEEVLVAAHAQATFRDWSSIVGETLASKSWPDRYGKGVVWVAVEGSAWASELRMRKHEILDRLREKSGDYEMFKDIRFGVRPLPHIPAPPTKVEPPPKPPEPPAETLSIREIAERRLARWKEKPLE
jgi:predicted nucleic acid-binding Zn ribbon protein